MSDNQSSTVSQAMLNLNWGRLEAERQRRLQEMVMEFQARQPAPPIGTYDRFMPEGVGGPSVPMTPEIQTYLETGRWPGDPVPDETGMTMPLPEGQAGPPEQSPMVKALEAFGGPPRKLGLFEQQYSGGPSRAQEVSAGPFFNAAGLGLPSAVAHAVALYPGKEMEKFPVTEQQDIKTNETNIKARDQALADRMAPIDAFFNPPTETKGELALQQGAGLLGSMGGLGALSAASKTARGIMGELSAVAPNLVRVPEAGIYKVLAQATNVSGKGAWRATSFSMPFAWTSMLEAKAEGKTNEEAAMVGLSTAATVGALSLIGFGVAAVPAVARGVAGKVQSAYQRVGRLPTELSNYKLAERAYVKYAVEANSKGLEADAGHAYILDRMHSDPVAGPQWNEFVTANRNAAQVIAPVKTSRGFSAGVPSEGIEAIYNWIKDSAPVKKLMRAKRPFTYNDALATIKKLLPDSAPSTHKVFAERLTAEVTKPVAAPVIEAGEKYRTILADKNATPQQVEAAKVAFEETYRTRGTRPKEGEPPVRPEDVVPPSPTARQQKQMALDNLKGERDDWLRNAQDNRDMAVKLTKADPVRNAEHINVELEREQAALVEAAERQVKIDNAAKELSSLPEEPVPPETPQVVPQFTAETVPTAPDVSTATPADVLKPAPRSGAAVNPAEAMQSHETIRVISEQLKAKVREKYAELGLPIDPAAVDKELALSGPYEFVEQHYSLLPEEAMSAASEALRYKKAFDPLEIHNQFVGRRNEMLQEGEMYTWKAQKRIASIARTMRRSGKGVSSNQLDEAIGYRAEEIAQVEPNWTQSQLAKHHVSGSKLTPYDLKTIELSQHLPPEAEAIAQDLVAQARKSGEFAVASGALKAMRANYGLPRYWNHPTVEEFGITEPSVSTPDPTTTTDIGWFTSRQLPRTLESTIQGRALGKIPKVLKGTDRLELGRKQLLIASETRLAIQRGIAAKVMYRGSAENAPEGMVPVRASAVSDKGPTLWAEAVLGEKLNKLYTPSSLKTVGGWAKIAQGNRLITNNILFYSAFHPISWGTAYFHSMTGLKALDPMGLIWGLRHGAKVQQEMGPALRFLIRDGGLVLASPEHQFQGVFRGRTPLEKLVEVLPLRQEHKDVLLGLVGRGYYNKLFGPMGMGRCLKATVAEAQYAAMLKTNEKAILEGRMTLKEIARAVGRTVNAQFGGQNYELMGVGKTAQNIRSILLFAPDWTDSNIRQWTYMVKKGQGEEATRQLARKVMFNAWWRSLAMQTLGNIALACASDTGHNPFEELLSGYAKRWNTHGGFIKRGLNFVSLDMTPVTRQWMKVNPNARFVYDVLRQVRDVPRFASDPYGTGYNKASPLVRFFVDAMTASYMSYEGPRHPTHWTQLLGIAGNVSRPPSAPRPGSKPREKVHFMQVTKKMPYGGGPVTLGELPSHILHEVFVGMPIPVQMAFAYSMGQIDALMFFGQVAGLGPRRITERKPKKPVMVR